MLFDPLLRFFFGRDIFISYSRRDSDYAVALANALRATELRPSCYLDKWAAPPGKDLPPSLRRHLRWSSMLVLIGSEHALASPAVAQELLLFSATGKKILPIDVGGALQRADSSAPHWAALAGAAVERESTVALAQRMPAPEVIGGIERGIDFIRQETRLRHSISWTATGVLLLLLAAVLIAGSVVRRAAGKAEARVEEASQLADARIANANQLAETRIADANRLAEQRIAEADAAVAVAADRARAAGAAADLARQDAIRQEQIAHFRRLANQAESIRARQPRLLQRGVLLAVEALRGMTQLGLRSLEADQVLRDGMALLPRQVTAFHGLRDLGEVAVCTGCPWIATAGGRVVQIWRASDGGRPVATVEHLAEVIALAFDPGGEYLATGAYDNTARLVEAATGRVAFTVEHTDGVSSIAFSRDGSLVATASEDGLLHLSRMPTGERVASMVCDGLLAALSFSPDGTRLTAVDEADTVYVWEAGDGRQVLRRPAGEEAQEIVGAAASLDRRLLVTIDEYGQVRTIDTSTGSALVLFDYADRFSNPESLLYEVAISPDARLIATSERSKLHLWTIVEGTGRLTRESEVDGPIDRLVFSPDGRYLATATSELAARTALVQVWDVADGKEISRVLVPGEDQALLFGADGGKLVTADVQRLDSIDSTLQVWDVGTSLALPTFTFPRPLKASAFSPDGSLVAVATGESYLRPTLQVREAASGRLIAEIHEEREIEAVAFSPRGEYLAIARAGKIAIWKDWQSAKATIVAEIDRPILGVYDLAFSPRGTYLAASYTSYEVYVSRNWQTKPTDAGHFSHAARVAGVAFSPDERFLAVGCSDDEDRRAGADRRSASGAWLWRLADGVHVATLPHEEGVPAVAFSHDGRSLAAAAGNTVRVWQRWDTGAPQQVAQVQHEDGVYFVGFDRDGRYLMTTSVDHTARVWEMPGGQEVLRVGHASWVEEVAFSADASHLLTVSQDGTARVWPWSPAEMIGEACRRLTRNLTPDEWRTYQPGEPWHATCDGLRPAEEQREPPSSDSEKETRTSHAWSRRRPPPPGSSKTPRTDSSHSSGPPRTSGPSSTRCSWSIPGSGSVS